MHRENLIHLCEDLKVNVVILVKIVYIMHREYIINQDKQGSTQKICLLFDVKLMFIKWKTTNKISMSTAGSDTDINHHKVTNINLCKLIKDPFIVIILFCIICFKICVFKLAFLFVDCCNMWLIYCFYQHSFSYILDMGICLVGIALVWQLLDQVIKHVKKNNNMALYKHFT